MDVTFESSGSKLKRGKCTCVTETLTPVAVLELHRMKARTIHLLNDVCSDLDVKTQREYLDWATNTLALVAARLKGWS